MGDAWGGYQNGKIPLTAMKAIQGQYLKPDVADQLNKALAELKAKGIGVHINEGYRALGVPADQNVRSESQTSTKTSNQYFVYGVYQRGGPIAAYPGYSLHGWGKAVDVNPGRQNPTVKAVFAKYGFSFDIASEVWHAHYVGSSPAPAWKWMQPSAAVQKQIQLNLKRKGLYSGAADGVWGVNSIKGIQKAAGVTADGVPGPNTVRAVQEYAKKYGHAGSPVDMVLNEAWWSHFNAGLGA